MRKDQLSNREVYHIFTKSIAGFVVFNNDDDFERIRQSTLYYTIINNTKFSDFVATKLVQSNGFYQSFNILQQNKKEKRVQIIAYCFMPTHIHLILKQLTNNGISNYMNLILNSYVRYFNIKHKRKGPLWEARFKNALVDSDEQLLHSTRYFHLNPVTAKLVESPDKWLFSSYEEYLGNKNIISICQFKDIIEIKPSSYRKFVCDRISYQRDLAKIKKIIME